MAKKPQYRNFFSKGQQRRFRFDPDDYNPFANLADDLESFAADWKKSKINMFIIFGDIELNLDAIAEVYKGFNPYFHGLETKKRHLRDLVKLSNALKGIEALLDTKDPKARKNLQKIARKAYLKVVPKALNAYLTKEGARSIISTATPEEAQVTTKSKTGKTFWQLSPKGEYPKLWEKVVDIILDGLKGKTSYLKVTSSGIQSFSMKDLMSVEVSRSQSKYRSVFLMEEFGTGQNVEGEPRVYTGKGRTFFKVPPYLIQAAYPKMENPALKFATAAWYVTTKAVAYGEGQYAAYLKNRNKEDKKGLAEQNLANLARNLENWTYGYKSGELHKGRSARNLFFAKGEIVQAIRDIQLKAQEAFVVALNEEIKKFAPEFPGLRAILIK